MIIVEKIALEQMKEDALGSFPHECCGFMFGYEDEEDRYITSILVVNNVSNEDQRRRFRISPKDYLNAEQYAEKHNLTLLGVYHSHPNHPAIPSETDRVNAQTYFSYVILSILDKEYDGYRSWRLNEELRFEEEKTRQYDLTSLKINN